MYIEAFRATGNPADSNRGATPADYQNYIQSYIDITSQIYCHLTIIQFFK